MTTPDEAQALLPVTPEDIEFLARITEAGGNKAAAFTLRSVGAVGIVLEAQAQVIAAHRISHSLPGDGMREAAFASFVLRCSAANPASTAPKSEAIELLERFGIAPRDHGLFFHSRDADEADALAALTPSPCPGDVGIDLVKRAEAIINANSEYMEGFDRGQRHFGRDAVLRMVIAALTCSPCPRDEMKGALQTILALIGNVDHSRGHGANAAEMRGGMLNDIRDVALAALTPSALSEEMAGHDLIPEGEHARALTEVGRLRRLLSEIGDDLKVMPFSNNGDKLGRWHLALIGKVHDASALSGDAGETSLAETLDRIADEYSDGKRSHGPMVSSSLAAAASFHHAAELVRRHRDPSPIPALVEGLHAQVFGIHALADPALSHAALADGGQIHEAVHALVRALPAALPSHQGAE